MDLGIQAGEVLDSSCGGKGTYIEVSGRRISAGVGTHGSARAGVL
jgi:hypothetical protein